MSGKRTATNGGGAAAQTTVAAVKKDRAMSPVTAVAVAIEAIRDSPPGTATGVGARTEGCGLGIRRDIGAEVRPGTVTEIERDGRASEEAHAYRVLFMQVFSHTDPSTYKINS